MLPFCGYDMADYWAHWLGLAERPGARLPKVFHVNWFRRHDGRWLWPGFGDNIRVLAWVFDRCAGVADAVETPIGLVPGPGALDLSGLPLSDEDMTELLRVDTAEWLAEADCIAEHFARFDRLPTALADELARLAGALADVPSSPEAMDQPLMA
jgi:phosphoenolpyruvate carboxykinase (GTP)